MKDTQKPKRTLSYDDLFVPPPKMTETEQREALDAAHKAMHRTIKRLER